MAESCFPCHNVIKTFLSLLPGTAKYGTVSQCNLALKVTAAPKPGIRSLHCRYKQGRNREAKMRRSRPPPSIHALPYAVSLWVLLLINKRDVSSWFELCFHTRSPGNKWALEQAKRNLVEKYLLVGITEEIGDFVAILEATVPRIFKGATKLFNEGSVCFICFFNLGTNSWLYRINLHRVCLWLSQSRLASRKSHHVLSVTRE